MKAMHLIIAMLVMMKKKKRHRICLDVAFLRIKYTILRISVRYSSSESSSFILWNTF